MSDCSYQVVYLTGAPASGKSTLLKGLAAVLEPLVAFSYSKMLSEHIGQRRQQELSEEEIRRRSASLVTPGDVTAVDSQLVQAVSANRASAHIVIDTHAVTKETDGFRVTPFSFATLQAISPTMILVLYTEPQLTIQRILGNAAGRPTPTPFEAAFHTDLQSTLALIYGMHLGAPVHFIDAARPAVTLCEEVAKRIKQ